MLGLSVWATPIAVAELLLEADTSWTPTPSLPRIIDAAPLTPDLWQKATGRSVTRDLAIQPRIQAALWRNAEGNKSPFQKLALFLLAVEEQASSGNNLN
jgi:hypothetical protein